MLCLVAALAKAPITSPVRHLITSLEEGRAGRKRIVPLRLSGESEAQKNDEENEEEGEVTRDFFYLAPRNSGGTILPSLRTQSELRGSRVISFAGGD